MRVGFGACALEASCALEQKEVLTSWFRGPVAGTPGRNRDYQPFSSGSGCGIFLLMLRVGGSL